MTHQESTPAPAAASPPKSPRQEAAVRRRQASAAAKARWEKPQWRSKKKRAEFARSVSAHKKKHVGGRPRSTDRCPCGLYTRQRAEQRNHRCTVSPDTD